jgi:hypothetical protein
MRAPFLGLLIYLIINIIVDYYIYRRSLSCRNRLWRKLSIALSAIGLALIIAGIIFPARGDSNTLMMWKLWLLFGSMSIYIPKYIGTVFDLLGSLPRLWHKRRIKSLTVTGIALSCLIFVAMWWGSLINRYNIQVNEVTIEIADLPQSFDGMTIAQFSDLHTGTFSNDTAFTSQLVDRINALNADLIVFTGDIVNRQSDEADAFITPLSRLRAPIGVSAILGNHDYGDYREWATAQAKEDNMKMLYDMYRRMGIKLLLNETQWLHRGNDSIALIGVENIGDPPFKTYGSLGASYPDLSDNNTKILLTHNPQHWVDSIANNPATNIALSLSGHTHAMQIAFGRVSPAVFRYATWGGLYIDGCNDGNTNLGIEYAGNGNANANATASRRKLYVNIGAGTVGMPMRVGATPEITLLTLRRAN